MPSLPKLPSFRLPKSLKGLKSALLKTKSGRDLDSFGLHSRFLDSESESETASVLGTEVGAGDDEVDNILWETGEIPSLLELCAVTVFEHEELWPHLHRLGGLCMKELWAIVKDRREKEAELIRTKYTVSLRGCRDSGNLFASTLARRMDACASVKSLVLDDCSEVDDGRLLYLLLKGKQPAIPQLLHLSVDSCRRVTDASLVPIIKAYGSRLKTLSFSKSGASLKTISALAKFCPVIETVNFSHQLTTKDKHVCDLAKGCPKIRSIDVSYCKMISDVGISAIAQNLRHLEVINASYCPNVGKSVADFRYCRFLQRMRLQDCPLVTDQSLAPVLQECSMLEVLCIRRCTGVTVATIRKISDCCIQLHNLDMAGIGVKGNKAMALLAQNPFIRDTLQEFVSTEKVILRMGPHIWKLYEKECI